MTATDDWIRFIQEQAANAEKWAKENPLATGFIVIASASLAIFAANKVWDIYTKS